MQKLSTYEQDMFRKDARNSQQYHQRHLSFAFKWQWWKHKNKNFRNNRSEINNNAATRNWRGEPLLNGACTTNRIRPKSKFVLTEYCHWFGSLGASVWNINPTLTQGGRVWKHMLWFYIKKQQIYHFVSNLKQLCSLFVIEPPLSSVYFCKKRCKSEKLGKWISIIFNINVMSQYLYLRYNTAIYTEPDFGRSFKYRLKKIDAYYDWFGTVPFLQQ